MADKQPNYFPVPERMSERAFQGLAYAFAGERLAKAAPSSFLTRASQAVAYTIAGVRPDTWFGPLQPLQPMAPADAKGRAFDYLMGWNLQYIPRATEQVSFPTLKAAATQCDLLRLLIETRKDRMAVLDWEIRPKEAKKGERPASAKFKTQIDEVTAMLKSPDKRLQWGQWVREVLDQNLVYDAVSIYRRKSRDKRPYSWELVDGATIKVLLDASGRTPMPPSPAYQQVIKGIPAANYSSWTTGDMLYYPENPRVDHGYGLSRVEQCLRYISLQIARLDSQLGWYEEGNVPEGFMQAPKEMTLDQVKSMQDLWDSIFAGLQAVKSRRKVWWVPNGSSYTAMKEATLKGEIDEWIARVLCFAMSEDPTPFIKSMNRATAETAQMKAEAEGLMPSMLYVRRLVNTLIELDFGYTDIEFAWDLDTEFDPVKKSIIDASYTKYGIRSIDEVRESIGEEPLGGDFATPMVWTPQGYAKIIAIDPTAPKPMAALPGGGAPALPAPKDGKQGKDGKGKDGKPTPTTATGEKSGVKAGGGGASATKKFDGPVEIKRGVLNAHEIAKWLDGVAVEGAEKVSMPDLVCVVGYGDPGEDEQSAVMYVEGGARSVENLLDGRLALFFDSAELISRSAAVSIGGEPLAADVALFRPYIPITTGPASLMLVAKTAEPVEKADPKKPTRAEMEAALVKGGADAATLEKLDDAEIARAWKAASKLSKGDAEEDDVIELTKAGAYGGTILLSEETFSDENGEALGKATRAEVDEAAARAHPEPTAAQAEAGNYRHGHVEVQGLDISIENAKGSKRKGIGANGKPWSVVMPAHYGYVKRTKGADGDHVDVYVGPNPESDRVWIVDQVDAETGGFDEHKCFVGYDSWAQAQGDYMKAFSDGRAQERLGHVSSMSMDEFKSWLAEGPRVEPRSMAKAAGEHHLLTEAELRERARAKTVSVGTGLVAHDVRGQEPQKKDPGLRLHRLHARRGEKCEKGCVHCANVSKIKTPGFEKVIEWRKY